MAERSRDKGILSGADKEQRERGEKHTLVAVLRVGEGEVSLLPAAVWEVGGGARRLGGASSASQGKP